MDNQENIRTITELDGAITYQCPRCNFRYRDENWAKKCYNWCARTNVCNLEIIAHAEEG